MNNYKEIRLLLISSLIFSFLLTRCGQHDSKSSGSVGADTAIIYWENNKAIGILVPHTLIGDMPLDSASDWLHVYLLNSPVQSAIIGDYTITPDGVLFRPLVPFTPGLDYEVRLKGEPITHFRGPRFLGPKAMPELDIYPTIDTLPENALKLYFEFNKPMQEGKAMDFIRIVKNGKDTLPGVFLDMNNELWNKESTILTVWFDPGRIKRDLQPNKAMGPPLQQGNKYQLVVLPGWLDQDGKRTMFTYLKDFVAGSRDDISPDPAKWEIEIPKPETDLPVRVYFNESLDYVLIKNAIHILDDKGNPVEGIIEVDKNEVGFDFSPSAPWKAGDYILEVESRLEDNAGNNLNHPFDNDLTQQQKEQKESIRRPFQIR
jgi:hypothetical protein